MWRCENCGRINDDDIPACCNCGTPRGDSTYSDVDDELWDEDQELL